MKAKIIKEKISVFINKFYKASEEVDAKFLYFVKRLEEIEVLYFLKKEYNLKAELRYLQMEFVNLCQNITDCPVIYEFSLFVNKL